MSIRSWTDQSYETAKARHRKMSRELLALFAHSDWSTVKPLKEQVEALGADIKAWERKMERKAWQRGK